MQLKTNQLAKPTERIAKFDKPITLYSTNIEDVTEFAYFGSKITKRNPVADGWHRSA